MFASAQLLTWRCIASRVSSSVTWRSPAWMKRPPPERRSLKMGLLPLEIEEEDARRVLDHLHGLLAERPAVGERRFLGDVFVEDEQEELGALHDVDREGDLLADRLVVLLDEDAQAQVVVGVLHGADPVVGEDARRRVRLPEVPRLLGERAAVDRRRAPPRSFGSRRRHAANASLFASTATLRTLSALVASASRIRR